jgi:anti-sigma B factor antagonist
MDLSLATRSVSDTTTIDCVGRLVYGSEATVLQIKVKALIALGSKFIVLNLAGCTYIDSGALGVLTGLQITAQQVGCRIRLANPTPRIAKLLQTTNLAVFFDVAASAAPK